MFVLYQLMDIPTALVSLAFAGSIGMTLVILACALPAYKVWWPFMVVIFYITAPIPTLMSKRYTDYSGSSTWCREISIFLTIGLVVSAFALPIVLARAGEIIKWSACNLTLCGNVVVFLTLLGFFLTFDQDENDYNMW